MDTLQAKWKGLDPTVRTAVTIIAIVVVVLIVLLIVRHIVLKNKRVNHRDGSDDGQSHSSVIDASMSSGSVPANSSASSNDASRHHVRAANVNQPPAGPTPQATGVPTHFQQGPQVQAHQAVHSQKLVGTANVVQPTCPGGCGGQAQQPQQQVHAANHPAHHHAHQHPHQQPQGQIRPEEHAQFHQPASVPNYGPRMAMRNQARMAQEQPQQGVATNKVRATKEHFQQWVEANHEDVSEEQEDAPQQDSPRPKASRFASKNADD